MHGWNQHSKPSTAVLAPHQPDTPSPLPRTAVTHGDPPALLHIHQHLPTLAPLCTCTTHQGEHSHGGMGHRWQGQQGVATDMR